MQLEKYITAALQTQNRISVEGLGTFEVKHQSAQMSYNAQGEPVLVPPGKTLAFHDNFLALNDRSLVDEVCKDLFLSDLEAQGQISTAVSILKNDLNNTSEVALPAFGSFFLKNDLLGFVPAADNELLVASTGLGALQMKPLGASPAQPSAPAQPFAPAQTVSPAQPSAPAQTTSADEPFSQLASETAQPFAPAQTTAAYEPFSSLAPEVEAHQTSSTPEPVAFNPNLYEEKEAKPSFNWSPILRIATFIIPVLLLAFLVYTKKISLPFLNKPNTYTKPIMDSASIVSADTLHPEEQIAAQIDTIASPKPTQKTAEIKENPTNKTAETKQTPTEKTDDTNTPTAANAANKNLPYHIVVGAFEETSMANKLINKLKNQGYNAQIVGKNTYGWSQVAAASYTSKQAATNALAQLKSTYADAWIKRQ